MRNQRGEITTAIVIAIAAGAFIFGLISTHISPLKGLFGGQSAVGKKASFSRQTQNYTPIILESKGGQAVVAQKTELVYETGEDQSIPRLTLGERIGNFFYRLTTGGIVLLIIGLLFFPGAIIALVARSRAAWKQTAKRTVEGIRNLDPATAEAVKPALASAHDKSDKIRIDILKKELNK